MLFPLQILWNLRLDRVRKLSIMAIFGVGIVCIVISTIRVANIHSRTQASQPAPSWLMLWAVIEAAIEAISEAPPLATNSGTASECKAMGYTCRVEVRSTAVKGQSSKATLRESGSSPWMKPFHTTVSLSPPH
ncbi:MAG: hypothetical protein Q9198_009352 [Flavoplaca austrocitrina]